MTEAVDDEEDFDLEAEIGVRQTFAYFGRAMYMASCLEHGLTIALVQAELMSQVHGRARRERKAPSRGEWEAMFDAYMAKHDLLPLGTLIDRFRSVVKVEPALDAQLDEALRRRNQLAHGFFRERAVEFCLSTGRAQMMEVLERDQDLFSRADAAVQAAVAHIIPKLGIDPDKHQAQMADLQRSLLAEGQACAAERGS